MTEIQEENQDINFFELMEIWKTYQIEIRQKWYSRTQDKTIFLTWKNLFQIYFKDWNFEDDKIESTKLDNFIFTEIQPIIYFEQIKKSAEQKIKTAKETLEETENNKQEIFNFIEEQSLFVKLKKFLKNNLF